VIIDYLPTGALKISHSNGLVFTLAKTSFDIRFTSSLCGSVASIRGNLDGLIGKYDGDSSNDYTTRYELNCK